MAGAAVRAVRAVAVVALAAKAELSETVVARGSTTAGARRVAATEAAQRGAGKAAVAGKRGSVGGRR